MGRVRLFGVVALVAVIAAAYLGVQAVFESDSPAASPAQAFFDKGVTPTLVGEAARNAAKVRRAVEGKTPNAKSLARFEKFQRRAGIRPEKAKARARREIAKAPVAARSALERISDAQPAAVAPQKPYAVDENHVAKMSLSEVGPELPILVNDSRAMAALPQDFNDPASIFTGAGWLNFWPEGATKLNAALTSDSDARVYGGAAAGFDAAMRPSPYGIETFVNIRNRAINELEWSVSLRDFGRLEILGDNRSIAVVGKNESSVALIQIQTSDAPGTKFSRVDGNRFTVDIASAATFSFSVEGEAGGATLEEKSEDGEVLEYFTDMRTIMLASGNEAFALESFPPTAGSSSGLREGAGSASVGTNKRAASLRKKKLRRASSKSNRNLKRPSKAGRNQRKSARMSVRRNSWVNYFSDMQALCGGSPPEWCRISANSPTARIPLPRSRRGRRAIEVWKRGFCGYSKARYDYTFFSDRTLKTNSRKAWPERDGYNFKLCAEPSDAKDNGSDPYIYKRRPKTMGYMYLNSMYTRSKVTVSFGGSFDIGLKGVLGFSFSAGGESYASENNIVNMYPHGDGSLNWGINGPFASLRCDGVKGIDSTDLGSNCRRDPKWGGGASTSSIDVWESGACSYDPNFYVADFCDQAFPPGEAPAPPPPPPETTITGGPEDDATIASNAPSFSFTTDHGTSFQCTVDGGAFFACSSPYALSNLADGDHMFGVRALGPGGIDESPDFREFTVDTTPPDTAIKTSQYIWTSDDMGGADTVLFGDVNDDGKDDAVGYSSDPSGWGVAESAGSAFVPYQNWRKNATSYGSPSARGVLGDWNNDGIDTAGYYEPAMNRWFLSNDSQNPTNDAANGVLWHVPAGGIPVAGDWDGNGFDSIGYYVPSTGKWTLSNSITAPTADAASDVTFGPTGSRPVVGNWNGHSDARDSIGVFNPATAQWYLSNSIVAPTADVANGLWWGGADSMPIAGDWDGNGSDTVGSYSVSGQQWILSSLNDDQPTEEDVSAVVRWGINGMTPLAGDTDGDGITDIGGFDQLKSRWHLNGPISTDATPLLDDVDDDGRADAVLFDSSTGSWYVARSNGWTFAPYHRWGTELGVGAESAFLADVNNDDAADAIYRDVDSGDWMVALSDPVNDAFLAPTVWSQNLGTGATQIMFEDVTGDGKADATAYFADSGDWAVSRSNGTGFETAQLWRTNFSVDAKRVMLGDVDNDGDADAIAIDDRGTWFVAKSTTTSFSSVTGEVSAWATKLGDEVDDLYIGDINGDGRVDAGFLWPPGSGSLYFAMSTGAKFDAHPMDFGSPVQYFAFDSERNTTFQCKIDSGSWSTCLAASHTAPLSPGIHTISVRAVDAVGNVDPTPATRKIVVQPELRIDFGQMFLGVGEGYTLDPGSSYGALGAFGWKAANGTPTGIPTTTDLASPAPDIRYSGFATFSTESWEAALPNGDYRVHIVAGNPSSYTDRSYKINAESTTVIDGAQNAQRRFIEDTRTITIVDGALTISAAPGYTNDIAYIDVKPVTDNVSPDTTITSGPAENASVPTNVASFAFSSTEPNSNFECRLDGGIFAACESPYTTPKLTNGRHTVTVIATNQSGNSDLTPATRTFVVNPDQTLRVNFQLPGQSKADGYLVDSGGDFGNRNNGYTYGWSNGSFGTNGPRERNSTNAPDKRYDTLIHMGGPSLNQTTLGWAISVPAGNYRVRVVAGDPSYYDNHVYKLDVQGKRVVDAVPTSANRWAEGTVDVASTGTIAITQAAGAVNNKLDFVEITPITVASDTTPPVVSVTGAGEYGQTSPGSTAAFTVGVDEAATVACKLDSASAVPCLDDSAAELCQTFTSGYFGMFSLPYMDGQPYCSKPVVYNNLSLGTHTFTAVATDSAGNQSTSVRSFTVVAQSPIKINFQPAASPTHPGYLVDSGIFYGNAVVGGYMFGWTSSSTSPATMYPTDRNSAQSSDQRYDTFIDIAGIDDLQRDLAWVIAVPNGSYEVKLVAGDPGNLASNYKVDVEGQRIIDGVPTVANPWVEGTERVTVADGMLSLTQPVGARNNKLNFIEITPISDTVAPVINVVRPAQDAQLTNGNVSFSFMADEAVKYQCSLDGASFNDCKSGKSYSGLSAGAHALTITATDSAGNVGTTTRSFTVFGTAPIKVNFQPAGAETHPGNLVDSGATYGQRRNGYKYGWGGGFFTQVDPPPMVDRNAINAPDQRYDTFAALNANTLGGTWDHNWTIAVPSGQYSVRVVAGDPADYAGNYILNVQGKPLISGSPSAANPWLEGTAVVEAAANGIGESTINISQGYGASLNKVAFVEITPLDGDMTAPQVSINSPVNGVSLSQSTMVLEFSSNEEATFTCQLDSGSPVACGNDQLSQFCRNTTAGLGGTEWISIPTTDYCSPTKIYENLSAGSHLFTVTATDLNGNVSTATATATAVPTDPIRINFQPSASPTHPDYLVDSGQPIDLFNSNAPDYGWISSATPAYFPTAVDRNSASSPDQRYDTFVNIGGSDGLKRDLQWMKVVQSGIYDVRVVMGDATAWDANYKLDVEGQRIIDGVPTEGNRWIEGTKRVRVDTVLNLSQPEGARNNKINFIEITPTGEGVPPIVSISAPAEGAPVNSTAAVSFTADTVAAFQCKIDAGAFAPCKSTQTFSGLSVGAHTVTVSATDASGNSGTATRTFNVVPEVSMTAAVNFQPSGSTGYLGYLSDSGQSYGDRGNGAMYGWTSPIANSTERGVSTDQRYDTFVAPGDNAASWEMSLPYGTYRVRLVAGDPSDASSIYKWNAEGSRIIDGTPTTANPFVEGTQDVTVSDGKLTISTVRGGANQKLAFIEIAPVADTHPPRILLNGIEEGETLNQTTASVGVTTDEDATVQCKLDNGALASCGTLRPFGWSMAYTKTYTNLSWGPHSITVNATDAAGNVGTTTRSFVIGGPQQLKFQFLPSTTTPQKGYMADSGGGFAETDNGQSYGWAWVPSTSMATRSTNRSLDARYDSFVGMTAGGWTLRLMNGTYKVRVVAGDPLTPNIPYKVDVEDTRVIDAVPSNLHPWIDETKKVTVADGYLNVTSPVGSGEVRLNFIEVTRVEDDVAPNVYIATPVSGADAGNGNVVPSFKANEPATFRCRMDSGDFMACASAYNNLSLGSHVFSVEATDANNNVSVTTSTFTVNLPQIRVMFGPAGVSHPGYIVDTGVDYGEKDNGFTYGWSRFGANTWPATYDRNLPYSPDQRYDSFIDISGSDGLSRAMQWDFALPTGTYEVHVVEGDALAPADFPSYYKLDVEGTNVTNAVPNPQNRWVEGTVVVDVVDGKLTLKQDIEGFNNKLNYVDIRPVDLDRTAPETTAISPGETTTNTTPEIAFSSNEEGSTFQCKIDTGLFAACTSPYAPGPLTDGGHVAQVRAIDPAGNVDKTAALVSFTVDTGPPVVAITAPSTVTGDSTPTVEFSATDANAIVETTCSLNGATGTSCISGSELPTLIDGSHTIAVTATDGAGFSSTATRTFNVDTAAPNTSITSGPESGSTITTPTPTFEFSSSEAGTFECSVDSGEWAACTSAFSTPSLTDGSHTVNVRAKDSVGNTDPTPESRTFTVDTIAPDTTIVSSMPSGTIINTRTPNHGFSSTDPGSFECKIDSGAYASCTSPDTAASLADGSHTFYVRSQDIAGNYDPTPASRTFIVDLTPPVAPSNITFSSVTQTSATVNWNASTDANGIAVYNIYRNGSFVVEVPNTNTSTPLSGFSCGTTYTINVVANDPANNFTVSSNASLTTANCATPPGVTITSPTNNSKLASTSQSITFTATESPTSVTCKLDSGTAVACTSPHAYSGLSQGTHSVTVAATNAAGTGTAVVNFVVDSIAPVVSVTSPAASATTGSSVAADFTATDATSSVVGTTCKMDAGAAVSCVSGHAYSSLAAGSHTLIVAATDEAGNVGSVTRAFTVATTPVVTITAPTNGSFTTSTSASIAFTATNSPTNITCQLDGGAASACTSPRAYTGLSQGAHSVTVAAANSAGTGSAVIDFTVDSIAPVVTVTAPAASATTGSSMATAFTATDATTSVVGRTCKMDAGSAGSCVTGHAYSGLTAGSHTLIITATDQAGNVGSVTRTFTVVLPPVVTISAPANASVTSSTSASVVFAATNSPTSTTCQLDAGAATTCTSPRSYTGLAAGSHTVTVAATNAGGTGTAAVTFTVDTIAPDTTITSGPANGASQAATTATYGFSSNESGTFECKIDSGTYAVCTSPFTTPAMSAGLHTFYVRAKDQSGNYDASPATRTITVNGTGFWEYGGTSNATGWGAVSLSAFGGYDWLHWGRSAVGDVNRKSPTASPGIGAYSLLGTGGTVTRTVVSATTFGWSGGAPVSSEAGTGGGLTIGGALNRGFRVSIPVTSANNRMIYVAYGLLNTQVKITASISDGSITTVSDAPLTNTSTTTPTIATTGFRVRSASPTATLYFDIQQNTSSSTGSVRLYGATVANE